MALQIRISPNGVRAIAQQHLAIAEESADAAAHLSALANELGNAWDGGASGQVISSLHEIRTFAEVISRGVHSSAEGLMRVAQAFETVDAGGAPSPFTVFEPIARQMLGCPAPQPLAGIVGNLRIVPEQVRAVAAEIKNMAKVSAELGHNLDNTIGKLSDEWEGNAFNRYAATAAELVNAFQQMVGTLNDYAGEIIEIANRYEEVDESLARMFN